MHKCILKKDDKMKNENISLNGLEIIPKYFSKEEDKKVVLDSDKEVNKNILLSILTDKYKVKLSSVKFAVVRDEKNTALQMAKDNMYEKFFSFDKGTDKAYFSFLKNYLNILKENGSLFGIILITLTDREMHFILSKEIEKQEY